MHPSDGQIHAYTDGELPEEQQRQLAAHLADCPACRQRAEALEARSRRVHDRLTLLEPDQAPSPAHLARARLDQRIEFEKEHETMFDKLFSRRLRPVWAIAAVIALLAVSLTIPSVRAAASSFLGLFRVQQVSVIEVDPGNLPERMQSSTQLEALFADDVDVQEYGDPVAAADAAEAASLSGLAVRLPASLEGQPELMYQPGGMISMQVDLERVQLVLDELGFSDLSLPPELDQADVSVEISDAVQASYGMCQRPQGEGFDPDNPRAGLAGDCTVLTQMRSPVISAPENLDIQALGEAFLQVMGMSPEEAASYAANVDWATTLVIPIPRGRVQYQEVSVDGVTGTMFTQNYGGPERLRGVIWLKDGIVYSLSGPLSQAELVQAANSLQ